MVTIATGRIFKENACIKALPLNQLPIHAGHTRWKHENGNAVQPVCTYASRSARPA